MINQVSFIGLDPEDGADLVVGPVVHQPLSQDLPVVILQLAEARGGHFCKVVVGALVGGVRGVAADQVGQGGAALVAHRAVEGEGRMPAAAEEIPVAVVGEVDRNPAQPGGERGVTPKVDQIAVGPDERVLHDFLGIAKVVEQVVDDVEDPVVVMLHDLGESRLVAAGESTNEEHVAGGLTDGRFFRGGDLN
jgi:hypothetical protein